MYDHEDIPGPSEEFETKAHVNDKINKLRERVSNLEDVLVSTCEKIDDLYMRIDLIVKSLSKIYGVD